MNILLTNDDGIDAQGLFLLAQAASQFGTVYIVAPHDEQSAIGHGITIRYPIRLHEHPSFFSQKSQVPGQGFAMDPPEPTENLRVWSLEAKPADCVKFALYALHLPIDVVFSGMNNGPNLGTDIMYSGTLAGASEGVICGLPAVAFSCDFGTMKEAGPFLKPIIGQILANELLTPEYVLNVNLPSLTSRGALEPLGIRVTEMGVRPFLHEFVLEGDVYWSRGSWDPEGLGLNSPASDVWAFENGYTSITPIQINRTVYPAIQKLTEAFHGADKAKTGW